MAATEYNRNLSIEARLEARAAQLGDSGGAALDAELLLDARSAVTDLVAVCLRVLHGQIDHHAIANAVNKAAPGTVA